MKCSREKSTHYEKIIRNVGDFGGGFLQDYVFGKWAKPLRNLPVESSVYAGFRDFRAPDIRNIDKIEF